MTDEKEDVLLLEPSSGISGDMFLASLIDLGLDREWLIDTIRAVLPENSTVKTWKSNRNGISGTRFQVKNLTETRSRKLEDVIRLVEGSDLEEVIKKHAVEMFKLLGEVEAGIHEVDVKEIQFHEVGALDSIADIVGAAAGIWRLDPKRVYSTPVNLGGGTVESDHGELPVPAPATAEILRRCEAPTTSGGLEMELTTPTGALILSNFVDEFSRPPMQFRAIGYGLGSKKVDKRGNLLRTFLGSDISENSERSTDHELVLETNIDDMNPELFPVVEEKLLEAGALDVFKTPVQMKKNRPGVRLTVICDRGKENKLMEIIFRETTTLGIRIQSVNRKKLDREIRTVETEFGPVNIKLGFLNGDIVNLSPELDSCKSLAKETRKPVKVIYQEAVSKARSAVVEN